MKHPIRWIPLLIVALTFSTILRVAAQSAPQNLSTVNVDNLSDSQVRQIIQQAHANGLTDNEIVQNAEAKGMSVSQGDKLQSRISSLQNGTVSAPDNSNPQTTRSLNYRPDTVLSRRSAAGQPVIFGADLFSSSNTSFEPNLKLATPLNYILGPEDQLNISVYGQSVVNWKLVVSPEGNINLPSGGIINVSGKTIEQATSDIRARLIAKHYAIGHGSELKVTLGDIRSIKVIMVGNVTRPGTYTLSSLATAFNALSAAGGPDNNGSYRKIEIIRNNRIVRRLDVYDFLVKGDQKDNIALQDQDIIRVPGYTTRVEISGEIKTPAIYEVLPGENLQDIINYAGGFTTTAYRASITVSQIFDSQRQIIDVPEKDFKNYVPLAGDRYTVGRISDRYTNRVTINGAVFRPGEYELQKGMMLSQLLNKAAGLREDAFTGIGTITRLNSDNTTQLISFNVKDLSNKTYDLPLQREDIVTIQSIFDLRNKYTVNISGEIRSPGDFAYADSMTVQNLILLAGGFNEGASPMRIEVARRITGSDPSTPQGAAAKVFSIDVDPALNQSAGNFILKPFDIVLVYRLPGYEKQGLVRVEGEVLYPGPYAIDHKGERISDIIKRTGGLTPTADIDGSTLKRDYVAFLGVDRNKVDTNALAREHAQQIGQLKQTFKDTTSTDALRNGFIGINLREIMDKPGSATDLIIKDGDVLRIPQRQQVVQINGEVHVPSGVVYIKGKSFKSYIMNAGGFSDDALRRGAYVIYPNGTVMGTGKFLFFNSYPEVKPGSEIFIPKKKVHRGLNAAEVVGLLGAISTTAVLVIIGLRH